MINMINSRKDFRITDYFNTVNVGGKAHFQFHGKMMLDEALYFFSKHFVSTKPSVTPEPVLIVIAKNRRGERWLVNRSRVEDEDLAQIYDNQSERGALLMARQLITAQVIRLYNPWGEKTERRKLPILIMRYVLGRSPIVTTLDATVDEIAGLIHEVNDSHILGYQPRKVVADFMHMYPVDRRYGSKPQPPTPVPEQDHAATDELRRYLQRGKDLAYGG